MPKEPRNYREEYDSYHGKPSEIKKRAKRNAARKKKGLKKGDSREVDHKKSLSKGGGNSKENLKVTTKAANRKKYNK